MSEMVAWQRNPHAVTAAVGDEIIFLHEEEGIYYRLNAVGAVVWNALEEPRTLEQLVEAVCAEYDVEAETARADLRELTTTLSAKGLVEEIGRAADTEPGGD